MSIALEKYHGLKSRFTCPSCGKSKEFTRYQIDGKYIADNVGICNRSSNCGYHYAPKQFFADNPHLSTNTSGHKKKTRKQAISNYILPNKNGSQAKYEARNLPKKVDYIGKEHLLQTLTNYEQNNFVQFLLSLFRDDQQAVWQAIKDYFIGTYKDLTALWLIDRKGQIRTAKLMRYDVQTGKRQTVYQWIDRETGEPEEIKTYWIHSDLKKKELLKNDFNLNQCFFGEHLTTKYPDRPLAIVEAEKTAVIASISKGVFPTDFVWLGAGSCTNLNLEKLLKFRHRKIILYPDANKSAFDRWRKIASQAQLQGLDVRMSMLLENHATDEQKAKGFDLADYLITEQKRINEYNCFADSYNDKFARINSNVELLQELQTIIEERKAVMMFDGGMSETEAERQVSSSEYIQTLVWNLVEV